MSSPEVSSLQETFNMILCTEISSPALLSAQMSSAFVGQNNGESGKSQFINSGPRGNIREPNFGGFVCYYYCKLGHLIRD